MKPSHDVREPFESDLTDGSIEGVLEARWSGHIDVDGLRAFCAQLEERARDREPFALRLDVRDVVGYDPDVRDVALAFAASRAAVRLEALALVVDSPLAAIESPAVALALPRRARLFDSLASAAAWLGSRVVIRSGEFVIDRAAAAARSRSRG